MMLISLLLFMIYFVFLFLFKMEICKVSLVYYSKMEVFKICILFQLVILLFMFFFSYWFVFLLELFLVCFLLKWVMDFNFEKLLIMKVMFFFSSISSFLFFSFFKGFMGMDMLLVSLFLSFMFKFGFCSVFLNIIVEGVGNYSKLLIFYYLINTKILLFFYSYMIVYLGNLKMLLECVYFEGLFFMILIIWVFIGFSCLKSLISKNMEMYIINTFCLSQFYSLFIIFLNVSVFFIFLFMDLILMSYFYFAMFYKSNLLLFVLSYGSFTSVMFFMFICQCTGMPPFPSFYFELGFLFIFYLSFHKSLSLLLIFILLFMFFHSLQFIYLGFYLIKLNSFYGDYKGFNHEKCYWMIYYFCIYMSLVMFGMYWVYF